MKVTLLASVLLTSTLALAQTSGPRGGVSSEWDVRKLLEGLDLQTQHLKPIIERIKPETWVASGAPEAYVVQWKTGQAELRYLLSSSEALARQPDRLTLALDTYFRMMAMESTFGSVIDGIRKYQNPALADLVQAVMAENSTNRDRLRQYIQDLAEQKEQEFKVVDHEAQRCRDTLLHQPASQERKPVKK
jgi:hypothetical protein